MWVPVNLDLTSAFYGELGSLITMSHAVKTNLSVAVDPCTACHFSEAEYASPTGAAPKKYLSFLDLGHPDADGNGRVDPMWEDRNAPPVELACANGLDDDGDGLTDCADPDCVGLAGCALAEVKGMCTDGIDNDGDGLVDCADPGCARDRACR